MQLKSQESTAQKLNWNIKITELADLSGQWNMNNCHMFIPTTKYKNLHALWLQDLPKDATAFTTPSPPNYSHRYREKQQENYELYKTQIARWQMTTMYFCDVDCTSNGIWNLSKKGSCTSKVHGFITSTWEGKGLDLHLQTRYSPSLLHWRITYISRCWNKSNHFEVRALPTDLSILSWRQRTHGCCSCSLRFLLCAWVTLGS